MACNLPWVIQLRTDDHSGLPLYTHADSSTSSQGYKNLRVPTDPRLRKTWSKGLFGYEESDRVHRRKVVEATKSRWGNSGAPWPAGVEGHGRLLERWEEGKFEEPLWFWLADTRQGGPHKALALGDPHLPDRALRSGQGSSEAGQLPGEK